MFLSSISDTRQKVHFQKTQNLLFIFISSLLCFKNGGQEGHRKIPLSLKDHHYCLLQGLSARPSNLLILIPSSLFLSLSNKLFKIYPDYWILCLADDDGIPLFSGIIDFDSPPLGSRYSSLSLSSLFSHKIFWNVLE